MPIAAMPLAMPAAAPMQMMTTQAPTFTFAAPAVQAAPRSTCGSDNSLSQLEQAMVKALVQRALNGGAESAAPAAAPVVPAGTLDERLAQLAEKMTQLEHSASQITKILEKHDAKISALEGK